MKVILLIRECKGDCLKIVVFFGDKRYIISCVIELLRVEDGFLKNNIDIFLGCLFLSGKFDLIKIII